MRTSRSIRPLNEEAYVLVVPVLFGGSHQNWLKEIAVIHQTTRRMHAVTLLDVYNLAVGVGSSLTRTTTLPHVFLFSNAASPSARRSSGYTLG